MNEDQIRLDELSKFGKFVTEQIGSTGLNLTLLLQYINSRSTELQGENKNNV